MIDTEKNATKTNDHTTATSRHSLLAYYVTLNLKKTIRESSAAAPSPRVRTGRPPTECLPYVTAVRPVRYRVCDRDTSGHTSHVCVAAVALSPCPRRANDAPSVRRYYNNTPLLGLICPRHRAS